MAITLDSMVLNTTLNQQPRVTSSTKADLSTGAFDLASQRIGQQVSATNVQLSAFGQIKSGYADIQSAAHSLSAPGKSSTPEDTSKAVQTFTEAFNKTALAVNSALNGDGKIAGALAGNGHASIAGFDLKKIVTNGNNEADLKKIGISLKQDGTLSVDTKVLQNAIQANPNSVQETLARVSAQAEQVAGRELAASGNLGHTVNALSSRAKDLETKATELQKLAAHSQDTVLQQSVTLDSTKASNISSYLKMLSS